MLVVCFVLCFLNLLCFFLAGFGCSWFCFCVDRICALLFGMLLCLFSCFFPIFFLWPGLQYILVWYCAFCLYFNPFIYSFSCWFGAVLFILACTRVCHASKQSRYLRIGGITRPLFTPSSDIILHKANPNHSYGPHAPQTMCSCFCCLCRFDCVHDHKCVGGAQVCLPAFLGCICVY